MNEISREQSGNRWGQALQRSVSVFYAPVATFQGLARASSWADWAVPILLGIVLGLILTQMTIPYLDVETPIRAQLEERGISSEQIETIIEGQLQFWEKLWIPIVVIVPIVFLLLLALPFWGGTFLFGGRVGFGTTLSVLA